MTREPKYPGQRLDEKYRRRYRQPRMRGSIVEYADGSTYEVEKDGSFRRVVFTPEGYVRIRKAGRKKTSRVR